VLQHVDRGRPTTRGAQQPVQHALSEAAPRRTEGLLAAALLVAAAVPLHAALALGTDLSPDEAYYLCAARRGGLVPSLVDHPPLLPWLLRLGDHLGGPVELRMRLWAILFSAATGLAIVALARRFGARRWGLIVAAWVGSWALLPTAGGFVTTPDGAALLAVAVALLAAGRPRGWPLAAAALFAGALAKVVVLPIALILALAELRAGEGEGGRRAARARAAALLAGPALALPLLVPSLRFQLHHAFTQRAEGGWSPALAIGALLAAVTAQALLWSPPVLWLGGRALPRVPLGPRAIVLGLTGLVAASALARGVPPEPNWWAPAALVVVAAAAVGADALSARARRGLVLAVVAPTLIAAAHTMRPFLPLAEARDPTARLHGWSRGLAPIHAPGVGLYGPAAERCIYQGECIEIVNYFNEMNAHP
jgi:Dolichyl-phosphate-mannose-protein mannosyltransferase